jgi:trigger factor
MNITRNNIDKLNAEIRIAVGPEDYENRVNEGLKKVQRKATLPGFRPGKVPSGLIKKQYGNAILVDELNKLLDESIQKYIEENKLDILGHPLPKTQEKIDFEKQKEFEFVYELGLVPEFSVSLDKNRTFRYKTVKVDDGLVDKYVNDIRRNHGERISPDVASEKDTLEVDINELDENGDIRAGGIFKKTNLQLGRIQNEQTRLKFTGTRVDDKVVIHVNDLYETDFDKSIGLGVDKETAATIDCRIQVTVRGISRVNDAELNQELFDRLYGEGKVTSEEEFRTRVREELAQMFRADSERFFIRDMEERFVEEVDIRLPDEFLKRWITTSNEKPITTEEIEKEYPMYAKGMRWQLIQNKIIGENNIRVTKEEAEAEAGAYIRSEYSRYGYTPDEGQISKHVQEILSKEKDRRKIYENLFARKVADVVKEKCTIETAEVSYEDFFGR